MTDIPSTFQHKFRATPQVQANGAKEEVKAKVQKRNRPVVSCLPCRNRKSRCDREHPTCGTCKASGNACVYQSNTKSAAKSNPYDRLAQLEGLVLQLMQSKDSPPAGDGDSKVLTPPADTNSSSAGSPLDDHSVQTNRGGFSNGIDGPQFVGPTNWESVLENINGLMEELEFADSFYPDARADNHVKESLCTTPCPPNLDYVLKAMPDRGTVNQLLAAYFNARIICLPVVHVPHFQRMHERFWQDPSSVPVLWISQLFSMLALGCMITTITDSADQILKGTVPHRDIFFRAAAQCLVLGNWEKPQRHVVEALFGYALSKTVVVSDPAADLDEFWVLYGAMIRLAYRLGYHREPSNIPGISIFEAEMRRRVWHVLKQFDLISAFQLGLPCNIHYDGSADVSPPRNLLDTDFDEFSTELPPSRPGTELTGMVYFIAKGALMNRLREVFDAQLTKQTISYEEDVLRLDRNLRNTYLEIADILRARPISESYTSPPWLIMNRLKLGVLYHKCLCVLHRQHLDQDPRHQYSLNTCVQSSMEILRHQQTLHSSEILGRRLTGDRLMVTQTHLQDFSLAAIIAGFILCNFTPGQIGGEVVKNEMIMLLRSALIINNGLAHSFRQTARFSAAITLVLQRVEGAQPMAYNFNFQDFSGPSTAVPSLSPNAISMQGSDPGLQDFEQYLNNPDTVDWSFIDSGMLSVPMPDNTLNKDWNQPVPDATWMADFQTSGAI